MGNRGIRRAVVALAVAATISLAAGCGGEDSERREAQGGSAERDVVAFTAALDESVPARGLADPPMDSDDYWVDLGDRYCRTMVSELKLGHVGYPDAVAQAMGATDLETSQLITIAADAREHLCPGAEHTEPLDQVSDTNESREELAVNVAVDGLGRPGSAIADGYERSCMGSPRFQVQERASAQVLDENGTEVGTGSLEWAQIKDGRCVFGFWMFMDVDAPGDAFTLEVSPVKPLPFTRTDMSEVSGAYWQVDLEVE